MKPLPGYKHLPNKVFRLHWALYRLKQAWYADLDSTVSLRDLDLFHSYDAALFICRTNIGIILLLLYVDDNIITGDDTQGMRMLQTLLNQQFEMKDLGTLSYFCLPWP